MGVSVNPAGPKAPVSLPRDAGRLTLAGGFVIGLAVLTGIHFVMLHAYWDYSEGVYAMTSRLMIQGHGLYGTVVGAQPPGVFLFGAAALSIHDGLEWLRFGVALWQLLAGLIAGRVVLRLTGSRLAAMLTPAVVLLTPWAVHEHGSLTPELVSLPFVLGLLLTRRPIALGVLCGLLPLIKVPYLLPAVAILAFGAAPEGTDGRRRAAFTAAATLLLGLVLTTVLAGSAFWRDVFVAQTQSGYRGLGVLKGYWAQAGWNLIGLIVPAGLAVRWRAQSQDAPLLRSTCVLAVAMIATFLTNTKQGTGLNIAVPIEASIVPLAVCGVVWAWRGGHGLRVPRVAIAVATAFLVAQSGSLLVSPKHSVPFLRAFSAPAWAVALTGHQFEASVALARRCPAGQPYGGAPLIAFAAGRQMLANEPDQFLVPKAKVLRPIEDRVLAAARRGYCLAGSPT